MFTWFCEITWQIKPIISPITQRLSTSDLVWCWLTVRGAYHLNHMTCTWPFDHVTNWRSHGTLKNFYLHNTHGNLVGCWQQGGASAPNQLNRHRLLVKRKTRETCQAVYKQIQFQCHYFFKIDVVDITNLIWWSWYILGHCS